MLISQIPNFGLLVLSSYAWHVTKETETSYREESATDICVSEAEVGIAVNQLNSGKALDEYGLSSEHLKQQNQ